MTPELLAFIFYFAVVLGIGLIFMFKSRGGGEEEYFLGGRSMGPWVTAMSAQASDMSGWLLMGFPGSILAFGMGQVWIGIGLALGTIANWIFVAKRLRNFSKAANDSITLPQYLNNRFSANNRALQIICAIVFLVFFTLYVASSFVAGATVLTTVVPQLAGKESIALLIFALIIIAYTFSGGFKAVCWTDFFQGIMMLVALLAVPIIILVMKDLDTAKLTLIGADGVENMFNSNPFSATPQEIITGLSWGLGYFGMPHILVRFMSIKKPSMIKTSSIVAIVWVILSIGASICIAIFGRMLVGQELVDAGAQQTIFIRLVRDLFPGFIAGILLSAIVAAAMSTADSQLLVASSSFTSDIYKPVFRKNASDKEVLWVGRLVVVVVSVVAYFIASSKGQGAQAIMDMVENAWGGFGAAFGPVVILSLFWKRATYKGAIAGVVGGAVTDVLWLIFLTEKTGIYEIFPGFIVGLICCIVVSLIDKKPSDEIIAIFNKATAKNADAE
ncbi:MAG: sodium/proline symporter PutP [Faecalibacterium sp.]|nr:sodium/proline symporter PutP [Ruminococcus sp.]MCM1391542.1 sodium/proline symporter PutP [Ruminococcus sp.]MCM1485495.1 sodium/proline symporter PutP [Faecalibacterium sp.]